MFIILNFFVFNRIYGEGDKINIGKLTYIVNSSHITNEDKYGRLLNDKYDYLVVNISIINNQATGYLDKEVFRAHIDNDYYYPLTSSCDSFNDIGECYNNQQLKVNTTYDYILVYKIKPEHEKIYLEILKNKGDNYKYSKVSLSYKTYEKIDSNYKLNDTFKINNYEHKVISYELVDKTSYQYQECVDEKCNTYTKTISPKTGEMVLVLEISDLKELSDNFLKNSLGLKYGDKKVYGSDIKIIDHHENKVYLSVQSNVNKASNLSLIITTREHRYNISLNGG